MMKKYLNNRKNIKIFSSMRFEHYLTLLENCEFIIGNSSSAIMEAPYFNVPSINLGNRQLNRFGLKKILNSEFNKKSILNAIKKVKMSNQNYRPIFGNGNSAKKIINVITSKKFDNLQIQKFYKNLR
jgi:UDP-N-acetylglucosamine 2-epimerase (hydrolysing)